MVTCSVTSALSFLKMQDCLHVRVSIKGDCPEQYNELTGAHPDSYELPYKALGYLIRAGVSCNACLMASFSDVVTFGFLFAVVAYAFAVGSSALL